jgi:hypothetical protein
VKGLQELLRSERFYQLGVVDTDFLFQTIIVSIFSIAIPGMSFEAHEAMHSKSSSFFC